VKLRAAPTAILPAFAATALLALLAQPAARAAIAYVSDDLVLGVYAEQNGQGQRLATLHSGASIETLAVNGEFTQVRLGDGIIGWVKSAYLTAQEPAAARVKQLQEELDRSHATTPALAEAAARSELEQLKGALKDKQAELELLRAEQAPAAAAAADSGGMATAAHPWVGVLAVLAALTCGFWMGYATLARRVRHKFGGIKVY
jgi:hypothetical protein